ncbi:GMC oxidoreductase [Mesorhizobium sp. M0051]
MGPAADPGVGPDLRVRGATGLIVYTSIMPAIISGNTHAAVIAIAERAPS